MSTVGTPQATPAAPRVLIAGGGTGGHLFPGLAIAEALRRKAPGTEVRFAGSSYGIEHRVVPEHGYRLYRIAVRGLYGVSWLRRLRVAGMLPWAFLQCLWVLLTYRPHLVLGVGGYASGPVLATAMLLRFRTALQEQNAYPGLTNRLLGRHADAAFTAVPDAQGFFRRALCTGTPVRAAILALRAEAPQTTAARSAGTLLLVGGSQGARVLNQAMMEALSRFADAAPPVRIVHQTGAADLEAVRAAYADNGLDATVVPFIPDMAAAYREARLIVSRAGASAVNEIVTARRAAVLVPIPGTSGEHQLRNAQRLAEAGAAVLLEQAALTGESLAQAVLALWAQPARLDAMEAATDALYAGDAAETIATHCLDLIASRQ